MSRKTRLRSVSNEKSTALIAAALALMSVLVSCSRSEPSHSPLGLGPLAIAEERANADNQTRKAASSSPNLEASEPAVASEATRPTPVALASAQPSSSPMPAADAGIAELDGGTVPLVAGVDSWLGLFRGSDVTRYVMIGQPERNFDDPNAKIRVEKRTTSRIGFVLIDSSNGQDLCELQGDINGNEATLFAGQRCFIDPDDDMSVSSRPGLARLQGDKLSLNVVLDATLSIEGESVDGRIEYSYEGRKQ